MNGTADVPRLWESNNDLRQIKTNRDLVLGHVAGKVLGLESKALLCPLDHVIIASFAPAPIWYTIRHGNLHFGK
jgi:hypothetical protein